MEGIPIIRTPLYPSHSKSPWARITNYITYALTASTIGILVTPKADVNLVYHGGAGVGLPAILFKWFRRVPFIYHIADMWPESVIESGLVEKRAAISVLRWLITVWCRFVYRQASLITVLSPGFKKLLIDRGVPAEKIEVVFNWAQEDAFYPVPADPQLAAQYGFAGKFNVFYAGNLGPMQGLSSVMAAAESLKQVPEIQFIFAGSGTEKQDLQRLVQERGLSNVVFLPQLSYEVTNRLYAVAQVLLIHLKNLDFLSTTIPGKTQTCLAVGRPVVMGIQGDAAKLITESGAGYAVEPENSAALAEAILRLHASPECERRQMGENGRRYYLQHLSLKKGANRIFELCLSTANRS